MVVGSPGRQAMARWPMRARVTSVTAGCHAYGQVMLPVSSRTGLGAWHATCSGVGLLITLRTRRQKGLVPRVSPCVKSNAPGPSVVPAAKLQPMAAGQVLPGPLDHHTRSPVALGGALGPGGTSMPAAMSRYVCLLSMGPCSGSTSASPHSACATSACLLPTTHALRMSSGHAGPRPWHISERPPHVEVGLSHGSPVSMQKGPCTLGEVSPTAPCANAATNPTALPGPTTAHSCCWA
mmetsp:Transcript_28517/g.72560  ORF Transcript_28517/g.72560 Transcript_28517/m.72560 type:complete len:237 (-) Transcript_28517:915-1625(-)